MLKTNHAFRHDFVVQEEALDENNHVNNVVYLQWMQNIATMHSDALGGTQAMHEAGAAWVVRSHRIDYLSPAFANEEVTGITWITSFKRVRSTRRYRFLRASDHKLLAQGETDWVLIDARTGRPRKIPESITSKFPLFPGPEEPWEFAASQS